MSLIHTTKLPAWTKEHVPTARIDPRAALLTTAVVSLLLTSLPKYELGMLLPYLVLTILLVLPMGVPFRRMLPFIGGSLGFVLMAAAANPLLDPRPMPVFGGAVLRGGWVSLLSVLGRVVLLGMIASATFQGLGVPRVTWGMRRLGVPEILTSQILFILRYLSQLRQDLWWMNASRRMRCGGVTPSIRQSGPLLATLLLSSLNRAEEVHRAMITRGFSGSMPLFHVPRMRGWDVAYALMGCSLAVAIRLLPSPATWYDLARHAFERLA